MDNFTKVLTFFKIFVTTDYIFVELKLQMFLVDVLKHFVDEVNRKYYF
jgi:hypothetical protein